MKSTVRLSVGNSSAICRLLGVLVSGSLLVTCHSKDPEPLRLLASFRLANNNCTAPCDPGITNLSQFGQSYRWDFGDGGTSTDETPKYMYAKGGSYALKLTIQGEQGMMDDTTVTVTVQSQAPTSLFAIQNNNCTVPCEVTFQNQSQHAQSYGWEFGDGTTASTESPKHTYTKGGTFTAKLTANGDQGKTASSTQTVTVKAPPVPVASFLIINDNCIAPCTVTLRNQSTDATAYSWEITTGYQASRSYYTGYAPVTRTTTDYSPLQNYSDASPFNIALLNERLPYTAKLTATGPGGTVTVSKTITIREPLPVADFVVASSNSLGKVTFQNKSVNATSYLWNFGNGTTSTEVNPIGGYGSSGLYVVTLQATNSSGTSEVKKNVGVTVVK